MKFWTATAPCLISSMKGRWRSANHYRMAWIGQVQGCAGNYLAAAQKTEELERMKSPVCHLPSSLNVSNGGILTQVSKSPCAGVQ